MAIGMPPWHFNEIAHGKRSITADAAIRPARHFGTWEEFWMHLQSNYEPRIERRVLRENRCWDHATKRCLIELSNKGRGNYGMCSAKSLAPAAPVEWPVSSLVHLSEA